MRKIRLAEMYASIGEEVQMRPEKLAGMNHTEPWKT